MTELQSTWKAKESWHETSSFKKLTGVPPRTLYHYCGPEGLIGILTNSTIRCTSYQHVNDPGELAHAPELLKTIARDDSRESVRALSARISVPPAEIGLFSLSQADDSLPQWREYCPAEGGYAIGFNTRGLLEALRESPMSIPARCIYEPDDQQALVRELLDTLDREWLAVGDHAEQRDQVVRHYTAGVWFLACYLKRRSFEHEREWRLFVLTTRQGSEVRVGFRPGRGGVVPYFDLALKPSSGIDSWLREIVIGPCRYRETAEHGVRQLLAACGSAAPVRHSEVDFRSP